MGTRGAPQCWGEPAANTVEEPARQPRVEPNDSTIYVEGVSSYNEYDSHGGTDVGAHATFVTEDLPSGGQADTGTTAQEEASTERNDAHRRANRALHNNGT